MPVGPTFASQLDVLRATPSVLRAIVSAVDGHWLSFRSETTAWTPLEILAHLLEGEQSDWIPRMRLMLAENEPTFTPFDRAGSTEDAALGADELLSRFSDLRTDNVAAAEGLKPSELVLTGIHPELGRVTMRQLIATWATHDLTHIAQIAESLARRNRDAVGPWRAFLPTLDREGFAE